MGSAPDPEDLQGQQHLALAGLVSPVSSISGIHRNAPTAREDVELLPRNIFPRSHTSSEVLGNYFLRRMREPIRELR